MTGKDVGAGVAVSEPSPARPASEGPLLALVKDQRIAFIIVGGVNTLVGFLWFLLFNHVVGPHIGYMGALICAHVCAVLCAFVLHRRFVFRVHGQVLVDLARFELVNLGALAANVALLPVMVELVGMAVVPAQLLVTVITVIGSYVGHRLFSFRRKPPASEVGT